MNGLGGRRGTRLESAGSPLSSGGKKRSLRAGDRYGSYAQLAGRECEGRDFVRLLEVRPSGVAIIAPHGGGIEPGTSEIAQALAGSEFSLYCFEGVRARGNRGLHLTSIRFDEPSCIGLVQRSRVVVAVHGCEEGDRSTHVGGLDEDLKTRLLEALGTFGFKAVGDSASRPGLDPRNICNRGASGKGVQLEISKGLRLAMFEGLAREQRQYTTPHFGRFVLAVRGVLLAIGRDPGAAES